MARVEVQRALVRCTRCGGRQRVPLAAVGYGCEQCGANWWWAPCGSCDHLQLVLEAQDDWRCAHCGTSAPAWWKAHDADARAEAVRRRREALHRRRVRLLLVVILAGVLLIAAAVAVAVALLA